MSKQARWTLALGASIAIGYLVIAVWLWPYISQLLDGHRVLRQFSIPSESMRPTLEVGDRLFPRELQPGDLKRGAVVLYHVGDQDRVNRIVAMAGDRVAMRDGVVILNGDAVPQRFAGPGPKTQSTENSRRLLEQFPGEAKPHAIFDTGSLPQDNFPEVTVPAGHLFVLGDNRDNSADSRFGPEQMGVGMVPEAQVFGTVDRIIWSRHRRAPRAVDDLDP